jgi:hypothetical protein
VQRVADGRTGLAAPPRFASAGEPREEVQAALEHAPDTARAKHRGRHAIDRPRHVLRIEEALVRVDVAPEIRFVERALPDVAAGTAPGERVLLIGGARGRLPMAVLPAPHRECDEIGATMSVSYKYLCQFLISTYVSFCASTVNAAACRVGG